MTEIAVDTSALVEIMIEGPDAQAVRTVLRKSSLAFASSATRVEAAFVMMGRFRWTRAQFEHAWEAFGLEEMAVDPATGMLAIDAFESWGRGRGTAGLNFGDCFSYALAASRQLPLLFVGNDFARTDIARA